MKKILLVVAAVLASAILVTSCGSTTTAAKTEAVKPVHDDGDGEYKVIDYQGKDVGLTTPDWVLVYNKPGELAKLPYLQGKVIITAPVIEDEDYELLMDKVNALDIGAEFAGRIKRTITTGSGASRSGDASKAETAKKMSDAAVGVFSSESISGIERIDTFWTKRRYSNGRLTYSYYAIFGMNDDLYETQIGKALGKIKAETEEEKASLEKIHSYINASAIKAGALSE